MRPRFTIRFFAVAFLIFAGFAVRFGLMRSSAEIEVDGSFYAALAQQILNGESCFQHFWPPFFSVLTAGMSFLAHDLETAGRLVSLIFGTAFLPLIYLITSRIFSPGAGLVAICLAAFEPNLCRYSSAVLSEAAYLYFFWMAIALSGLLFQKKNVLLALACGLCWGLAYLTRQEGSLFFLITFFILSGMLFFKKINAGKGILLLLVFAASFLALSYPYLNYLKETTGKWTLTDKTVVNLWLGKESVGPDWIERREKSVTGLAPDGKRIAHLHIPTDPELKKLYKPTAEETAKTYLYNVALFFKYGSREWLPPLLILFFGMGFYVYIPKNKKELKFVWFYPFLIPFFLFPLFYFQVRYFLPLIPAIIILSSLGIYYFSQKFNYRKTALFIVVFLCAASFIPYVVFEAKARQEQGDMTKKVGEWIRENFPEKTVIMARRPQSAFYAGKKYIHLPYGSLNEILEYAKHKKVELIMLQQNHIDSIRPRLRFLFESSEPSPDLRLVHEKEYYFNRKMNRVRIFEIKEAP